MKTTITIVALLAIAFTLVNVGYDRHMEHYCTKLQTQSEQYPNFHLSKLDHDECKNVYGIKINAPIK